MTPTPAGNAAAQRTLLRGVELYRVAGEDSPVWIAGGLVALGLALAVVAGFEALGLSAAPKRAPIVEVAPAPSPVLHKTTPLQETTTPPPPQLARVETPRPAPATRSAPMEAPPNVEDKAQAHARIERALRALAAQRKDPQNESNALAPTDAAGPQKTPCLPIVGVPFARSSARPALDGVEPAVKPLLDWLRDHPEAALLVEGHADATGDEKRNVVLSYERAQAMSAWLTSKGVAKWRLSVRAAGAAPPSAAAPVVAENRQALIAIEGAPRCSAQLGDEK
jgi:outer membrane protein OmpA-like peptidoglycan-associated protein